MNHIVTERRGWHLDEESEMVTRHPFPTLTGPTTAYRILALTDEQLRHSIAVHEAGHAVLMLALSLPFECVVIADNLGRGPDDGRPAGFVHIAESYSAPLDHGLVQLAAGERAQDRWLREAGLWTSDRAWVVERLAASDRKMIAEHVRTVHGTPLTYGVSDDITRDLAALHGETDGALDTMWDRVLRLAGVLDRDGRLSHAQAADAAGFTLRPSGGAR